MNNKGFFLSETLIVVSIVAIVLILFYRQITSLYSNYEDNYHYDTIQSIHAANNIKLFLIDEEVIDDMIFFLGIDNIKEITDYDFGDDGRNLYFLTLIDKLKVENLYFSVFSITDEVIDDLPEDISVVFINYLKTLRAIKDYQTKYRIIVHLEDGSYSSLSIDNEV